MGLFSRILGGQTIDRMRLDGGAEEELSKVETMCVLNPGPTTYPTCTPKGS